MLGRTAPCWGRGLLSQCHFGYGHLSLSYTICTESPHFSPPSCYTMLFCEFQQSQEKKLKIQCFLLICLLCQIGSPPDQARPSSVLVTTVSSFRDDARRVCGVRHWMSVGPFEGRPCLLGAGPFMLGWDNSQLG